MDVVNWILGMLCKRFANYISPLLRKPQKMYSCAKHLSPKTVDDNNTHYDGVDDRLRVCEVVK